MMLRVLTFAAGIVSARLHGGAKVQGPRYGACLDNLSGLVFIAAQDVHHSHPSFNHTQKRVPYRNCVEYLVCKGHVTCVCVCYVRRLACLGSG